MAISSPEEVPSMKVPIHDISRYSVADNFFSYVTISKFLSSSTDVTRGAFLVTSIIER